MNWFRKITAPSIARAPCGRLVLEALEDRCLLATGFTEIALPPPANGPIRPVEPAAITAGPDGNLWFTDQGKLAVGKITPAGVVTEFPLPDPTCVPQGITTGPDGNLWFTEYQSSFTDLGYPNSIASSKIAKITPAGVVTEFPLPDPSGAPLGITVGPDGNLWFTESRGNRIGNITTGGTIQEFAVPTIATDISSRLTALEIVTGPDGNLWYTELDNKVGRISPTGTPLGEFALSAEPSGITTGPDGNVWVAESEGSFVAEEPYETISATNGGFARITSAGAVTEFHPNVGGASPDALTTGPDGNLWFTADASPYSSSAVVGSLRPDGSLVAALPVSSTSNPGITVGPRGEVLFPEPLAGKIGVVHNYVETLYEDVLGRPASSAEQNYWVNVQSQQGPAAVAAGIQGSDEAHARLVAGWYQTYLGRPADGNGLQFFVNLLRTDTAEQALAHMLASPEYATHAVSDQDFVQALYMQLLGRAAGTNEPTYWQMQEGQVGREAAAVLFMGSGEYRTDLIQNAYQALLHRSTPASAGEVGYWLSLNLDSQSLKVAFEQTDEFARNG